MTTCLKRLPVIELDDGENEQKMKELVKRITNFCKNLVDSILDIFGGRLLNEGRIEHSQELLDFYCTFWND